MNTKSNWQQVNRELMAENRRTLGEPPTAEEMLAYQRGELSPEAEERVREHLVANPQLARALSEPFPTEDARPGEPGYVSDDAVSRRFRALQQRLHTGNGAAVPREDARVLHFWRRASLAMAAMLVLAFGALFWQVQEKGRLQSELTRPRVAIEESALYPDGNRGAADPFTDISAGGESLLLPLMLVNQPSFSEYRLELVDAASRRSLWKSAVLPRGDHDTASVVVPRTFLTPGRYRIVLYGVAGAREEQMATYSIRVPARP